MLEVKWAKLAEQVLLFLVKLVQRPDWLLWGVFGALLGFYYSLIIRAAYSYDHISAISLGLSAIFYRLWQRRHQLVFQTSPLAWGLGILLLFWVSWKGLVMLEVDTFLRIMPAIAGLGFALISSGFGGLKQYWLEGLILGMFLLTTMPGIINSDLVPTNELSAIVTSSVLWNFGFDAVHQGSSVILPTGTVKVLGPCSPTIPIVRLLEMTVFFLAIYPTTWLQRVVLPLSAVAIAVGVNSIRIAILAVVNAAGNTAGFDYWHTGTGANMFSIANVIVFWLFWELLANVPSWLNQLSTTAEESDL